MKQFNQKSNFSSKNENSTQSFKDKVFGNKPKVNESEKSSNGNLVRLQKVIAGGGVCSRRKAEELILYGKVKVNGKVVTELGTKVNPAIDAVEVEGQIVEKENQDKIYIVLNKPRSVMTTVSDPEGRHTVMDFVTDIPARIYPVGRLDYLSEGLLIMTNDGDFAQTIIHPSYEIEKVYEVKVFGIVTEALLNKVRQGIMDAGELLRPKSVRVISQLPGKTWLEFRLIEGKNREIRRMCEAFNLMVDKLRRVAIGGLSITGISPGNYLFLNKREIVKLIGLEKGATLREPAKKLTPKKFHTFNQDVPRYISPKKTVGRKKLTRGDGPSVHDPMFKKFTKENYKEFMKTRRELKETSLEMEKTAPRI
jgi:23S rRNA pseudouridine2605 synthase